MKLKIIHVPSAVSGYFNKLNPASLGPTFDKKSIHRYLIIIAFLSYAAFLFWASQEIPIWIDEAATLSISSRSFSEIISFCLNEWDAPHLFYYLICHITLEVFPSSLFALRCISTAAALLSTYFVYQIGSKVLSKESAIAGAVIFLIAPVTFNFATQARSPILVILLSAIILFLIVKGNSMSGRFLFTINMLLTFNIMLNFLTYIFAVICFVFLFFTGSSTKSRQILVLFFTIPTLICYTLVGISREKSTISWIADDFSPLGSLHRVALWPLIENSRDLPLPIAVFSGLLVVGFFTIGHFKWELLQFNRKLLLCVAVGVLPPISLWFVSIFFPIFQSRYFAYSIVGLSILLSTVFTKRSSKIFVTQLGIFLISVSALQVFHIWNGRGASFDWSIYRSEISRGPQNQTLVTTPAMFSFLISYHTKNEIPLLSTDDILKKLELSTNISCSDPVVNVMLIAPLEPIKDDDYENEMLLTNGYRQIRDYVGTSDNVRRYRLLGCE